MNDPPFRDFLQTDRLRLSPRRDPPPRSRMPRAINFNCQQRQLGS
jgi:hypothetical protein